MITDRAGPNILFVDIGKWEEKRTLNSGESLQSNLANILIVVPWLGMRFEIDQFLAAVGGKITLKVKSAPQQKMVKILLSPRHPVMAHDPPLHGPPHVAGVVASARPPSTLRVQYLCAQVGSRESGAARMTTCKGDWFLMSAEIRSSSRPGTFFFLNSSMSTT